MSLFAEKGTDLSFISYYQRNNNHLGLNYQCKLGSPLIWHVFNEKNFFLEKYRKTHLSSNYQIPKQEQSLYPIQFNSLLVFIVIKCSNITDLIEITNARKKKSQKTVWFLNLFKKYAQLCLLNSQ